MIGIHLQRCPSVLLREELARPRAYGEDRRREKELLEEARRVREADDLTVPQRRPHRNEIEGEIDCKQKRRC